MKLIWSTFPKGNSFRKTRIVSSEFFCIFLTLFGKKDCICLTSVDKLCVDLKIETSLGLLDIEPDDRYLIVKYQRICLDIYSAQ